MLTLRASILTCLTSLALGLVACDPQGSGHFVAPPCANGIQDEGEIDVDCGGTCGACLGTACAMPTECASRSCVAELCAAPSCDDGIRNGTEAQIDCGGTCGACRPATCSNGMQDLAETGVDCGGPCTPCDQGPTCSDTIANGGETDVDCGGPCTPCGEGSACDGNGDCATGLCDDGTCAAPASSCTNNEKDPSESDVDCGKSCLACPTGKVCGEHGDCLSDTCIFGICRDPTCSDGVANQDETGVDCGGETCEKRCGNEERCGGLSDCQSNTCIAGVCKPEGSSAGTCEVEGDCASGFFCEWSWNESGGASADWDKACLVEREGAPPGSACEVSEDCAGAFCYHGFCTQVCQGDDECVGSDAVCASEEFWYDSDEDGLADGLLPVDICLAFDRAAGSCLSHADCPSGKRCTVYLDRNLTNGALDPDGPYKAIGRCQDEIAGGRLEGADCELHTECSSGHCGRAGICTRHCEASSECGPVVRPSGVRFNRVCTSHLEWGGGSFDDPTHYVYRSECSIGVGPLAPCGATAATPFVCEEGFACGMVLSAFGPDVKAKAELVCVLTPNAFAPLGADCDEHASCLSGTCHEDDDGANGYCTQPCESDQQCGSSGLTCQPLSIVERKGKYLDNSLSVGFCLE